MLKQNHINVGYTVGLTTLFFHPVITPLFLLIPILAVLPDIDHPDSFISKKVFFNLSFLKHRNITHSFLGIFVLTLIIYLIFFHSHLDKDLKFIIVSFILIFSFYILYSFILWLTRYFRYKSFNFFRKIIHFPIIIFVDIIGLGLALFILYFFYSNLETYYVFSFIFLLLFSHILGDYFTKGGVPLFRPSNKKFVFPFSFKTGSTKETTISTIIFIINLALFIYLFRFGQNIEIQINKEDFIYLFISTVIVLYFLSKDFKLYKLKKGMRDIVLYIIILLVIIFISLFISKILIINNLKIYNAIFNVIVVFIIIPLFSFFYFKDRYYFILSFSSFFLLVVLWEIFIKKVFLSS